MKLGKEPSRAVRGRNRRRSGFSGLSGSCRRLTECFRDRPCQNRSDAGRGTFIVSGTLTRNGLFNMLQSGRIAVLLGLAEGPRLQST